MCHVFFSVLFERGFSGLSVHRVLFIDTFGARSYSIDGAEVGERFSHALLIVLGESSPGLSFRVSNCSRFKIGLPETRGLSVSVYSSSNRTWTALEPV